MRLILSRILVAVLLPVFLLTCVGSAFGFAWCIGEDGHVEIERVAGNGCGDDDFESKGVVSHKTPTIQYPSYDHCGPCLDLSMQNNIFTAKRLTKITSTPSDVIILNGFLETSIQSIKLVVGNLAPQPPPRISQSILAHRTIVLLV